MASLRHGKSTVGPASIQITKAKKAISPYRAVRPIPCLTNLDSSCPRFVAGIHVLLLLQDPRRGWPGQKGVYARLRRAMPGHDGADGSPSMMVDIYPGAGIPCSPRRYEASPRRAWNRGKAPARW